MKHLAAPSILRRSLADARIAALLSGVILGGVVLMPATFLIGPLGTILVLACGAIGLAAWGSGSGADLQTNLQSGCAQALGVAIGCGGLMFVLGEGVTGELVVLPLLLFGCAVAFSFFAAMGFARLQGCAKRCDERRRIRSRGVSGHRARRTKPQ